MDAEEAKADKILKETVSAEEEKKLDKLLDQRIEDAYLKRKLQ